MRLAAHSGVRMNQRGITGEMLALAMDYGETDGEKTILSAKACRQLIEELKQMQKKLEHAHKKGGITVVNVDGTVITTYRASSFSAAQVKKVRG